MDAPTRSGWYAVWFPTPSGGTWTPQTLYCFGEEPTLVAFAPGVRRFSAPAAEVFSGADWIGPFVSETVARATSSSLSRRSA
jgi:hypothetical protein